MCSGCAGSVLKLAVLQVLLAVFVYKRVSCLAECKEISYLAFSSRTSRTSLVVFAM